ncbi:MAG: hypothetical protein ACKVZ6_18295 [Kineosporiaceae bacterium]
MPAVPRIQRAVPVGPVTTAQDPIPVVATIRWNAGDPSEVPALAVGWTRTAVEVRWADPWGGEHTDWLDAGDVRRAGEARGARPDRIRPPRSRGRRPRW